MVYIGARAAGIDWTQRLYSTRAYLGGVGGGGGGGVGWGWGGCGGAGGGRPPFRNGPPTKKIARKNAACRGTTPQYRHI